MITLGKYLRSHRQAKELSLEAVGSEAGLRKTELWRIEGSKASVDIYGLFIICRTIRCSYRRAMELLNEDMMRGIIGPKARARVLQRERSER